MQHYQPILFGGRRDEKEEKEEKDHSFDVLRSGTGLLRSLRPETGRSGTRFGSGSP